MSTLLAVVGDGDEIVAVRDHTSGMEVLDPAAPEQGDARQGRLSPSRR